MGHIDTHSILEIWNEEFELLHGLLFGSVPMLISTLL